MSPLDLAELRPQQLHTLLGEVLDALIVTDPSGSVVFMNSAARQLYGFSQNEQERLNLRRYSRDAFDFTTIVGENVPEEEQPLSRALRGDSYKDVELWARYRESGETRAFTFTGSRLEGDPPLGVLIIRDVTAQRKAEKLYRISFETNPAPTLIARLYDAVLIDANEGFTELTGLSKEEMSGSSVMDLGLLPIEDDLQQVLDGLKAGRFVHHRQTVIHRSGAGERDVLVSGRPIEIEGEDCGIFTFIDVTELKSAWRTVEKRTAELRNANDQLDSFNYSVSHDLRSPLRALHGFGQALLEEYGDKLDETGRGYLDRMKSGAERMGKLIDALLRLSRKTRGELDSTTVDLSAIAREVAAALQEEAPERRTEIEIADGLLVEGDEHMLRVVVENLLANAWTFTQHEEVTRIEVASERLGDEVVYSVRDNGVGFDPRYTDKLFVPFARLHRQEEFGGQGIGLAIVHRIVLRHSGRVWAEGKVGEGATFYFTLPGTTA